MRSARTPDLFPYRKKGPNGERYCRYCGEQVPKGKRTWCGEECVDKALVICQPGFAAKKVRERDRGVCSLCGTDTVALRQRARRHREKLEQCKALGYPGVWRKWWEADHIVPVSEGGGLCGLENYRTLCVPCHKRETAKLRKRLAKKGNRQEDLPGVVGDATE